MPVTIYQPAASELSPELIERWRPIPVAIAVDVSKAICQIDPAIRPLCPPSQQPRLFGRAVTVRCEPPDFGAVLYALTLFRPGDVLVLAANGNSETAMIGEILGGHVRRLGGAGIICDGAIRDVAQLAAWPDLAVFCRSITPRGPISAERGAVNEAVLFGGRLIQPGDLLIGDDDGLAALNPHEVHAYIEAAEAKQRLEDAWLADLAVGRPLEAIFGLAPAIQS